MIKIKKNLTLKMKEVHDSSSPSSYFTEAGAPSPSGVLPGQASSALTVHGSAVAPHEHALIFHVVIPTDLAGKLLVYNFLPNKLP